MFHEATSFGVLCSVASEQPLAAYVGGELA